MKKLIIFTAILLFSLPVSALEFNLKGISEQEIASNPEYTEAFNELDTDKDNSLSERELLKFQQDGLSKEKDETLKVFDADGDGKVTKEEYLSFFKNKSSKNEPGENLSAIFEQMDTNRDGNLSAEELKKYRLKNLENQNREIFQIMDMNQDGKLSREEFGTFLSMTKNILGNAE